MDKEDWKVVLTAMIPLAIVLWVLSCLCYGMKAGSIIMSVALIGTIVLICYLWFVSEWCSNRKRKKDDSIAKENVIEDIDLLMSKLNDCTSRIVKARLDHDETAHYKAMFDLESLSVSSQQILSFLRSYIWENVKQ